MTIYTGNKLVSTQNSLNTTIWKNKIGLNAKHNETKNHVRVIIIKDSFYTYEVAVHNQFVGYFLFVC